MSKEEVYVIDNSKLERKIVSNKNQSQIESLVTTFICDHNAYISFIDSFQKNPITRPFYKTAEDILNTEGGGGTDEIIELAFDLMNKECKYIISASGTTINNGIPAMIAQLHSADEQLITLLHKKISGSTVRECRDAYFHANKNFDYAVKLLTKINPIK